MTDQGPNLQQQIQEQATQSAQDFYGQSMGRVKSQIQNYRSQLEEAEMTTKRKEEAAEVSCSM